MRFGRSASPHALSEQLQARLPELKEQLALIRASRDEVDGRKARLLRHAIPALSEERIALIGIRAEQERLAEKERRATYDFVESYDPSVRFSAPRVAVLLVGAVAWATSIFLLATKPSTVVNNTTTLSLFFGGSSTVLAIISKIGRAFERSINTVLDAVCAPNASSVP